MTGKIYSASTTAPVNIATLKYWGKRDTKLNLPTNSSISVTLSQDDLRTLTTASAADFFQSDKLWLDGKEESLEGPRLVACLSELRALRKALEDANPEFPPLSKYHLHIISENNFPTAAGLASSAAGFAALVRAIANLYDLHQSPEDLSRIARQGSGSACRSMFGGYVAWEMGQEADGSDSRAVQIATQEAWPDMKAAILVISASKKETSSTLGMQTTVNTSTLFKYRAEVVVPQRFKEMSKAIVNKDFETFGKLTMIDSNQFHAVCLDSSPPVFYMNDTSRLVIGLIEKFNKIHDRVVAAYTFDAGPNAVLYYLERDEPIVLGLLKAAVPEVDGWDKKSYTASIAPTVPEGVDKRILEALREGVSKIILTGVGSGPQSTEETLVDSNGLPK
ncbi:GHMP kinase [Lipomyces tetrasporus]|uniref:Diphosphomevalonate decarboxylase n=1 Tax=Lipomyces tetrasporus TaxID=54092 RepID=A0AAD7QSC3_9ASCO|nr:GHMP kinase [Lipomyces tetrasporus]KAJ8100381.1 GHMP kinase [Lipomyces tetrasporus]